MKIQSSKKGVTPITVAFWTIVFTLLWFLFLAQWVSDTGKEYITINNATGFEAFFYSNFNLVIMIIVIIAIFAYGAFGGNSR